MTIVNTIRRARESWNEGIDLKTALSLSVRKDAGFGADILS